MMKKKFVLIITLLLLCVPLFAVPSELVTTITIKNARETSYKKSEETGNDTIVLEGSVEIVVEKEDSKSTIKADRVIYDRKTEMLYAEGNVEIISETSSSDKETTTASSVLLNTSTLEGVFDGGRVVQSESSTMNLPSDSTLIVFSDLFGKGEHNVFSFKNSSLTFCDEEDPHWHIDATRTWLLPGGELAMFNALLYVGYVPVLYLPAFYYPKDELVFNPVFAYSRREGYSVQTTTYLYGRKPLSASSSSSSSSSSGSFSSLSNFLKPSVLKQQKLEGLVLHNLDDNYTGDTTNYVKLMADWYANLGYMTGLDAYFKPSNTYVTKLALNAYLGFSNTIFYHSDGLYYPFSSTGVSYKDYSHFMGLDLPFRYGAGFEFELSKPFKISLSLPIYSDPFFAYDFKNNRSEYMDWISFLLDDTSDDTVSVSEVSSLTWQLSSSYSPSLPSFLKPYLNSLSFSLTSTVNISSMTASYSSMTYEDDEDTAFEWKINSPERKFYYPSLVTPANISLSIGGSLFTWPLKSYVTKNSTNYVAQLSKPDDLKTEKELENDRKAAEEAEKKAREKAESEGEDSGDEAGAADSLAEGDGDADSDAEIDGEGENEEIAEEDKKEEDDDTFNFFLPSLDFSSAKETLADGVTYDLSYSASMNYSSQIAYASSTLTSSDDFEWKNYRSIMYTLKTPVSLSSKFNYGGSFFSVLNQVSYNPVYQKHTFISLDESIGGYTESAANSLILADYKAESQDVTNSNTITFKPFTFWDMFSDTSFSWNSNIKLYRHEFTGDAENPEWEDYTVDWEDDDCITVNSFTGVLGISEYENKFKQNITLTAVMPPLLRQYTAALNLTFPYVTSSISTGYQETTHDDVDEDEKWKKSPLSQSLTVSLPLSLINPDFTSTIKLSESYTYNLEDENHDSLKLSASWASLQLAYVMSYTYGYDFDDGWIARTEKEFLPYSLSFSYSPSTKTFYRWSNRISVAPGLSTSIVADLLRPTNSYFLFSPSITFKIAKFLDVTFSSTSRNSVLYWYFQNNEGDFYSEWGGFPGNIFKDLIDSFRFDSDAIREASGFKLKSLNMTVSHNLHDWSFNMTLKIEPRLVTEDGVKRYDFNPYMTIGVVWNPVDGINTTIVDEYGEWSLE
ncbi:MAG: hypothetical protein K5786_00565 [Treponema sp.]|nr:hypothetical protein [Treponema sp.]